MKDAELIESELKQFCGTENYYQHAFRMRYTDGVKYLAEVCECYWLLDIVASYQFKKRVRAAKFQVYSLKVKDDEGLLTIQDGNGNKLGSQKILFTDFPLESILLYYISGICLLPSEY